MQHTVYRLQYTIYKNKNLNSFKLLEIANNPPEDLVAQTWFAIF